MLNPDTFDNKECPQTSAWSVDRNSIDSTAIVKLIIGH
jgi:hypothetical protein